MANRVVRSGILESDLVNKLTWPAEVFYRRLMSILDDFGLCDGRVSIMRSKLYPLRLDKVSDSDVSKWLTECVDAGLVRIYHVDNKPYLELFNFNQTVRIKKKRFPDPMQADASRCKQMSLETENEKQKQETESESTRDFFWFEKQIDEITLETLKMTHRGKDIPQAMKESYAHIVADGRLKTIDSSGCKKLLNTWLSNQKPNERTKKTTNSSEQIGVRTYSTKL